MMEVEEKHVCKICDEVETNDITKWVWIRDKGAQGWTMQSAKDVQKRSLSLAIGYIKSVDEKLFLVRNFNLIEREKCSGNVVAM